MSKFLDDFLLTMNKEQAAILKNIYSQEAVGLGILDKEGLQESLNRLRSQIEKSKDFSFEGRHQSGKINSENHNQNMEEIYFDLKVLFNISSEIDSYLKDHLNLTQSGVQLLEQQLNAVKNRVTQLELILNKNTSYDEVIHETMTAPNYLETNSNEMLTYATERFNEPTKEDSYAQLIGNGVVLASHLSEDQVKTNMGRKLADIQVKTKTGYSTVIDGHEIDKAFDSSKESYWAENILVDEPIEQTELSGWTIEKKYDDLTGALCQLEIRLDAVSTVSDIHFDPFCSYPIQIVDITGYENKDFGGKSYSLIAVDHENENQQSQISNKKMIFRFPSKEIGSLRITIRQENFTRENYLMKKSDIQNMQMWNKLSSNDELLEATKNPNETMAEFNRKLEITGWSTYIDALKEWATDTKEQGVIAATTTALNKIKTGNFNKGLSLQLQDLKNGENLVPDSLQEEWIATNKTSYIYGAYNISIYGRKYKQSSVYVSKPFNLSSNSKKITLSTKENQVIEYSQQDGTQKILTDIEYYLTAKKNPTSDEWIPILPLEQKIVRNEMLLGDSLNGDYPELKANGRSIQFGLRFGTVSKESVAIKKNGIAITKEQYIVSDDGKKVALLANYYDPSASYTVSYRPIDKAYYFDTEEDLMLQPIIYTNKQGQTGERFYDVKAGSTLKLENKPYLSRSFLFEKNKKDESYKQKENVLSTHSIEYPIQIWVDKKSLLNITDYDSNSYDPERLKENNGYTFAQIGTSIILGAPEDTQGVFKEVVIDYHYIINSVRMKAILRRTTLSNDSVTPEILEYTIQCINKDLEV